MALKTFAAIDVGSFELAMKIFEISPRAGLREIDDMIYRNKNKNRNVIKYNNRNTV